MQVHPHLLPIYYTSLSSRLCHADTKHRPSLISLSLAGSRAKRSILQPAPHYKVGLVTVALLRNDGFQSLLSSIVLSGLQIWVEGGGT